MRTLRLWALGLGLATVMGTQSVWAHGGHPPVEAETGILHFVWHSIPVLCLGVVGLLGWAAWREVRRWPVAIRQRVNDDR